MVITGRQKKQIMAGCFCSVLVAGICFGLFEIFCCTTLTGTDKDIKSYQLKVISLPNEECRPRPSLITVGLDTEHYYPVIISLQRCGGACGHHKVTTRKCIAEDYNNIYVNVWNKLTLKNETLKFENHTSCSCKCVHDDSVCSNTQVWDEENCRCNCNLDPELHSCPDNYQWNPNLCQCECNVICSNRRKELNITACNCSCRSKFYKRCSRKQKVLRESDCKCYDPKSKSTGGNLGDNLSTKWAALLITISFIALFILAFDCILYSKSTGCLYISLRVCRKKDKKAPAARVKSASTDSDASKMAMI